MLDADFSGGGRKFGNITADQQQALWKQITDTINGMGIQRRTVAQIKRKWHAIKSKGINCLYYFLVVSLDLVFLVSFLAN